MYQGEWLNDKINIKGWGQWQEPIQKKKIIKVEPPNNMTTSNNTLNSDPSFGIFLKDFIYVTAITIFILIFSA